VEPEPRYPNDASVLRSGDDEFNGVPLFAVDFDNWPGARQLYREYQAGTDVTVSVTANHGEVKGDPTVEVVIASLTPKAEIRLALSCEEHRPLLAIAADKGRIALTTPAVFAALPDDGPPLHPDDRSVLVFSVQRDDFRAWPAAGGN
jgi:hypothetical protein